MVASLLSKHLVQLRAFHGLLKVESVELRQGSRHNTAHVNSFHKHIIFLARASALLQRVVTSVFLIGLLDLSLELVLTQEQLE